MHEKILNSFIPRFDFINHEFRDYKKIRSRKILKITDYSNDADNTLLTKVVNYYNILQCIQRD